MRYKELRSIFEKTLCGDERWVPQNFGRPSRLLLHLICSKQTGAESSFMDSIADTIRRKMFVRYWLRVAIIFSILALLVWLIPAKVEMKGLITVAKIITPLIIGISIASAYHLRPNLDGEIQLARFESSLVGVLWGVAEHTQGMVYLNFPRKFIRKILLETDGDEFKKLVDNMLINLAFEVKKMEPERTESDPELMHKRARFKSVHSDAYRLGVAEKNPKTYFDRAVPASVKVEIAQTT